MKEVKMTQKCKKQQKGEITKLKEESGYVIEIGPEVHAKKTKRSKEENGKLLKEVGQAGCIF